jgi:hypothetical protein
LSIVTALLGIGASPQNAPEPAPKAPLKDGRWVLRPYRDILGRGWETIVTIRTADGQYTIQFTRIDHHGVNAHKPPTESVEGPFVVTVKDQVLEYPSPEGARRYSFRFDGETLVLPAIVQQDDRTWIMERTQVFSKSPEEPSKKVCVPRKSIWQCAQDPKQTPRGRAVFPSPGPPEKWPQSYVYEQGKDEKGRPVTTLRFLEGLVGEAPKEAARFTWDAEQKLDFRGSGWFGCDQDLYVPLK